MDEINNLQGSQCPIVALKPIFVMVGFARIVEGIHM